MSDKCLYCSKWINEDMQRDVQAFCNRNCLDAYVREAIDSYIDDNVHEIVRDNLDIARECMTPD